MRDISRRKRDGSRHAEKTGRNFRQNLETIYAKLGKGTRQLSPRTETQLPPPPFDIEIFLRSIFLCQEKKQTFPRVISFLKLLGGESLLFSVE